MKSTAYRVSIALFFLFSLLAVVGGAYLFVEFRSAQATIPIASVAQYRNLSTTISVLFSLSADLQIAGADPTEQRLDNLTLSLARARGSLGLMREAFGGRVPGDFAAVLQEIGEAIRMADARLAAKSFDRTAAADIHNRLGFALAAYRDYVVGINDRSILSLDGLSRSLRLLGRVIVLALALTLFATATMAYLVFLQRRMVRDVDRAREEAVKASAAKSEFLAGMSHEIRTPLNAVTGMLHLLNRTALSPIQQDYTAKAFQSANILLGVINDILDFSKIEAGKIEFEEVGFDLEEVLGGQANLFHEKAREKGIGLSFRRAEDVPRCLVGDPLRLSQVLLNLIGNAVKFTHRGEVSVAVATAGRQTASIELRFDVIDTGIGISEDQIERLFAPFTQADSSMTRKYGGTGLGLALCRKLVDKMGGAIQVASRPGEGSTFSFTARFGLGSPTAGATGSGAAAACAETATAGTRTAHILLVEDNQVNRLVAEQILRSEGYRVETAENGAAAVDLIAQFSGALPYEAVLMDLYMPVMDGMTATREIRKLLGDRRLPIIAMTADAVSDTREKVAAAGMDDCITKPFDPDKLFALLDRWTRSGAG